MTYTYVKMEVTAPTYDEIAAKMRAADYGHAFHEPEGAIDMHGLALVRVNAVHRGVLMSPQNPDGWKLEELLAALQVEVRGKSAKIAHDPRLVAKTVLNHNSQIIALLAQAEAIQRQSYALLDDMAPNEGPLGKPRIGGEPVTNAARYSGK